MRRFLAMFVFILFTVYATPREIWHAFSGHEDTVHHLLKGVFVEPEHHHCEVLQFDQHLPLELKWNDPIQFTSFSFFYSRLSFLYETQQQGIPLRSGKPLRAPPVMM